MTWPVFPSTPGPAFPIRRQHQPKVLTASFGDSYEQQVTDGINGASQQQIDLTWTLLTNAQKATFEAFLIARGGASRFQYVVPGDGDTVLVACASYSFTYQSYNNWTLTATFVRKFDAA